MQTWKSILAVVIGFGLATPAFATTSANLGVSRPSASDVAKKKKKKETTEEKKEETPEGEKTTEKTEKTEKTEQSPN